MIATIATIQSSDIVLYRDDRTGQEIVSFIGDMDIDCDGLGGNPFGDKYYQPDTTLHYDGKPLYAEREAFVVVPPIICQKTKGRVLGALCLVTNYANGMWAPAVVGDIGPTFKVGEGSPKLATLLGVNPNPVKGGTSDFIIRYQIHVNVPAMVNDRFYKLQRYA